MKRILQPLAATLLLASAFAFAQNYAGTYVVDHPSAGRLTLVLTQQRDKLRGVLSGRSIKFQLEGFVYADKGFAAGAVYTAQGTSGFEAYLKGYTLGLYLFELDAKQNPIADSVIELIMTRQSAETSPPANPLFQEQRTTVPANRGGAGLGCSSIDDCMSQFTDPEVLQDTINAQNCWAAAGCEGYDSSTDTFDYEEVDYGGVDYGGE